jgi:isocitrate lyase
MQMVRAGLKAIYLSGWQVAADANTAGAMYPDQSLYPANSAPELAKKINRTLQRADQIEVAENGEASRDWFAPIVADAEAGFGGTLNCYEIMKAFIEAGAAGVHFEDQVAAEKKCGHLGGKVLIPTSQHERNLNAARLAADVMGVPTLTVARTDAESATLINSDVDERDHEFIDYDAGRTAEGFYRLKPGMGVDHCIKRGLAYAKVADLLWWETSKPNLEEAKRFAEAVQKAYPGKMMAYNCSPSFNWEANLDKATIETYQRELGAMGYKFQFVTLAGFHQLNYGMFQLASGYRDRGMGAYSDCNRPSSAPRRMATPPPVTSAKWAPGYFDLVNMTLSGGQASTTAMGASTETDQFKTDAAE